MSTDLRSRAEQWLAKEASPHWAALNYEPVSLVRDLLAEIARLAQDVRCSPIPLNAEQIQAVRQWAAKFARLEQERDTFHLAYRTDCDHISKAAVLRAEAAEARCTEAQRALAALAEEMRIYTDSGAHGSNIKQWAERLTAIQTTLTGEAR